MPVEQNPGDPRPRPLLLAIAAAFAAAVVIAGTPSFAARGSAPDPGGRELAIVKVPPVGKRYLGVHEPTLVGDSPHGWTPAQTARVARGAGAEIFRFTIDWTFVEPTQDGWDEGQWARYEAVYQALTRHGIKPLIGLSTAPGWARDAGFPMACGNSLACTYPPRPAMYGEWAEFVTEVARRFPSTAAIEIWNEPNLDGFWKPYPEPERYAALVATAYDAIKAEQPEIEVVAGALAAQEHSKVNEFGVTTAMSMRDFLTRAYQADPSIAGHMDGLSFHQVTQSQYFGPGSQMALGFSAVREMRSDYDSRRTPIWLTEFSLSTSDGGGAALTRKIQAGGLLRGYRKLMTMRDVRAVVIHTLADRVEVPRSDRERGVGLVASWHPFEPKPSYCAFAGRARSKPFGGCKPVRESHVSRCTRSLASLTERILAATGAKRAALERRHRETSTRCVPCARKHTARLERRCAPCERKLLTLQRHHARVIPTLRLNVLNRHERVRRECR